MTLNKEIQTAQKRIAAADKRMVAKGLKQIKRLADKDLMPPTARLIYP